jgi:3-deoxy-manno-octulosonate cytidylyltransferase (CMP-KDO synthetase)
MPEVAAVIPARLGSSRLAGKLLFNMRGKPLLYYAWKAAVSARLVNRVYVATDSDRIGRIVTDFGGNVVLTSKKPRNGTERVHEAMRGIRADFVINIQGDTFGLRGAILDRVIRTMERDSSIKFATLARRFGKTVGPGKLDDPDTVKVVADQTGHAAWFSRCPIPYLRSGSKGAAADYPYLYHIGVYFFRRRALDQYAAWSMTPGEKAESLEQLRILEHGGKIRLLTTTAHIISIDNEKSLRRARYGRK